MGDLSEIAEEAAKLARELGLGKLRAPDPAAREAAAREARRLAEKAESEAREAIIRKTLFAALPVELAELVLAPSSIETPALEAAKLWRGMPVRGLILRGGLGVGKTTAAAIMVSDSIRAGRRSVSWHSPDAFISAVMHAYDPNAPKLGTDLVVVDDIGRETKAHFEEALCQFIDFHSARFILTTNIGKDAFKARYDPRMVERLDHCAKVMSVKGESLRRKNGGF